MSKTNQKSADTRQLEQAAMEAGRAKKRLASSLGALQYRLKPATLMNKAWDGVRGKSGEVADTTLQAVKDRPLTVSGVIAAFVIFLARNPLWRLISGLFSPRREEDETIVRANLEHDESYDLTAPTVDRSRLEGVSA
jgi:hypothetical protein